MPARNTRARKTITEEVQVASGELVDRVKTLLAEGRVRHIRVKSPKGEVYFELPLAVGVIGGAALAFASPWLAMAASLAGLVASVKLEVVRENDGMVAVIEPEVHRETPAERLAESRRPLVSASPQRASSGKRAAARKAPPAKPAKATRRAPQRTGATPRTSPRGGPGKSRGRRG
jgi:hypothetical protein